MTNNIQKYTTYKPSGVEWLGDIPEHWEVKKLKFLGSIFAGINGKKGDDFSKEYVEGMKAFIPFTNICNHTKISENEFQYVRVHENEKQNRVQKNDILFLMSSETLEDIAKCSIYLGNHDELYLNSFCKGFRINNLKICNDFINYLLLSSTYRNYFALVGRGFTRINLKQEFINDVFTLLPPLSEQTRIAEFLDTKTALIDKAIGIKEKQIELLKERRQIMIHRAVTRGIDPNVKLKPSGVEWIGDIPEHWVVSKLGNYATVNNGTTPSREIERYWNDGNVAWIASGKVNDLIINDPSEYITQKALRECSLKVFPIGTILLGIVGQGKTRGTSALLNIPATINQNLAGIVSNEKLDSKFLHNFLMISYSEIRRGNGSNQEALNCQIVKSFTIFIPPLEEQKQIVTHIETLSSKIATAISLKEQEIEKLKEYKSVLINSAVTGKIKVG